MSVLSIINVWTVLIREAGQAKIWINAFDLLFIVFRFNGFVDGDSRPKSIAFMRLTEEQRERKFKENDALVCKEKIII